MPQKERDEARLAAFEKPAQHEREKPAQQQEDHDKHVRNRRGEIPAQLALRNRLDIGYSSTHREFSFTVSGSVIARNTSSSRPSSVCNSSIFQPSFKLTSATLRASSPFF